MYVDIVISNIFYLNKHFFFLFCIHVSESATSDVSIAKQMQFYRKPPIIRIPQFLPCPNHPALIFLTTPSAYTLINQLRYHPTTQRKSNTNRNKLYIAIKAYHNSKENCIDLSLNEKYFQRITQATSMWTIFWTAEVPKLMT